MSSLLREVMTALDMPEEGLRLWFARSRRFCEQHGGERYYREWMALYDQCVDELGGPRETAPPAPGDGNAPNDHAS